MKVNKDGGTSVGFSDLTDFEKAKEFIKTAKEQLAEIDKKYAMSAPLNFKSGIELTKPEPGAIEFIEPNKLRFTTPENGTREFIESAKLNLSNAGGNENIPIKMERDFKTTENIEQINKQQWEDVQAEFEKTEFFIKSDGFLFKWLKENYFPPEKKIV